MPVKNYYTILGVKSSATQDEIKAAYRRLVRKFHPDKNFGNELFEDHFKLIQEAYDVLSESSKRDNYDAKLAYDTLIADPEERLKFYKDQKNKPKKYKPPTPEPKVSRKKIYINSIGAAFLLALLGIGAYNIFLSSKKSPEPLKMDFGNYEYNKTDKEIAEDYFRKAKGYIDAGNDKFALIYLTDAIKLTPNDARLYFQRGLIYYLMKNYPLSQSDLTKAIELNPADKNAYWARAKLKYDQDDNAGAIYDYTQAIMLDSKNDSLYFNRGLAHYYAGNFEAAVIDIDRAIELNPNQPQYYFDRGDAKEMSGDKDGTCSDWLKAKQMGYNSPELKLKECLAPENFN